jgi:hypothetical protein
MKHFPKTLTMIVVLALSSCNLESAPLIGGFFPSETPTASTTPTATLTFTPSPTVTETPTQTPSPPPTSPPTITLTPGPFSFRDDFSEAGSLRNFSCFKCEVKNGRLLFGPFEPENNLGEQFRMVVCETCGEHVYYRLSVDATYLDGPTDRFYGIVGLIDADEDKLNRVIYLGISTWQVYTVRDYDYKNGVLKELSVDVSGYVNPGVGTNHIGIEVKPSWQPNLVDVYFTINGGTLYVLYLQPAIPTQAGMGMSFHSMTVAFDNFTYDEIEVK